MYQLLVHACEKMTTTQQPDCTIRLLLHYYLHVYNYIRMEYSATKSEAKYEIRREAGWR